ncbi:hypothetical protein LCGC14_1284480, partial [marine sediment metagenome]|nr:DUF551 domain-containing protein [Pricia sp.]
ETMPKEKREVMIYYTYRLNQNSYTGIASFDNGKWYSDDGKTTFGKDEVTHYMPIPSLPEQEASHD